jgi:phage repressor protein C with HTH and peptisase S24 domain
VILSWDNSSKIMESVPTFQIENGKKLESYPHYNATMEESIGDRLRAKRKQLNLSVPDIAAALGIPKDRIYKWEKGSKPSDIEDYRKIEHFIQTGLENVPRETPEQLSFIQDRLNHKLTVNTLLVPLVPIKAQAGYISSHDLVDYIEKLEKFPMAPGINPRGTEWRWFEVQGESMEPTLYEGDYILCSRVPDEDWRHLDNYYLYCIVTTGNMWIKRIVKRGKDELILVSDNKKIKQRAISMEEIREIWKVRRHLNARMPPPEKITVNV